MIMQIFKKRKKKNCNFWKKIFEMHPTQNVTSEPSVRLYYPALGRGWIVYHIPG